jgi:hypothetical protein
MRYFRAPHGLGRSLARALPGAARGGSAQARRRGPCAGGSRHVRATRARGGGGLGRADRRRGRDRCRGRGRDRGGGLGGRRAAWRDDGRAGGGAGERAGRCPLWVLWRRRAREQGFGRSHRSVGGARGAAAAAAARRAEPRGVAGDRSRDSAARHRRAGGRHARARAGARGAAARAAARRGARDPRRGA